jgi:phosphotransferase system, enzyme I, PtsP
MPPLDQGPMILIRRLRQIMAARGAGQERLDTIVRQIANLMVAEVCSIYVRRQDGSLELFATEGLNADAVHKTHMKQGEGLVGLIAEQSEPVNLSEAQAHPAFSYRPETGEEIYHSFLGVPVIRDGDVHGVLVVQNRTHRHYTDDEVEALETTAMVLAEHLASVEVAAALGVGPIAARDRVSFLKGQVLSEGIALGHIVLHQPRVVVKSLLTDDPEHERRRLDAAIERLRATIDDMLARRDLAGPGEHREVLETYRMFAHDSGWINRLQEAVGTGLTAEAVVERVRNDTRARMLRKADAFWRERFRDLDDLSDRLLRILAGRMETAAADALPDDTILVARTMGPAELLDYDRTKLRGLIIEEGGIASHVAIVAKALGIAAIGQVEGVVETVEPGEAVIVDAESGEIHLRPSPDVIAAYSDKARFRAKRQQRYAGLRDQPAITRGGTRVKLNINAGLLVDLPHLAESGADGIGLFRTELEFMLSSRLLMKDQQAAIYKKILAAANDLPVVFRTLDIGGDKLLPYLRHDKEENPAMGWRAIRMTLDRSGLFRAQIRALLKAAAGRELRIMLPMITEPAEYQSARAIVEGELQLASRFGWPGAARIHLGAMIEVPALLMQLDRLFSLVDFASIGSNDLIQFLFAADRNNARLAGRYDPLSPSVLRALARIVEAANRHDKPLTLCGEIAGKPLEAMALIGLGFRSISMAPASLGPIKAMVLSLDDAALRRLMAKLLDSHNPTVRPELLAFARQENVDLGMTAA